MEATQIKNGYLKNHLESLHILSEDYPGHFYERCEKLDIPLNKGKELTKTLVD